MLSTINSKCSVVLMVVTISILTISIIYGIKEEKRDLSIQCLNPILQSEKLICSIPDLIESDSSLERIYEEYARRQLTEVQTNLIVLDQQKWINTVRNKCITVNCLEFAYLEREHYFLRKKHSND